VSVSASASASAVRLRCLRCTGSRGRLQRDGCRLVVVEVVCSVIAVD